MRLTYKYSHAESNIEKNVATGQKRENRLKSIQNGCQMMELYFPNVAMLVFPEAFPGLQLLQSTEKFCLICLAYIGNVIHIV